MIIYSNYLAGPITGPVFACIGLVFLLALSSQTVDVRRRLILFILLVITQMQAHAQVLSLKDTLASYNKARMQINITGMKVLGAWGIASIADGGIGYFTAKKDDWKYFHEMNAAWGLVNTGIAAISLSRAKKEVRERMSYEDAYARYKSTKKLYLVNAGLDVVYIAAGVGLEKYSEPLKPMP